MRALVDTASKRDDQGEAQLAANTSRAAAAPGMTRAGEPWLPEEDQQLQGGMLQGRTARMIAREMQRTTRAVRRRAEILKLSWLKARAR